MPDILWRNAPAQRNIVPEGGLAMNAAEVAAMGRPKGLPFRLNKIGHLALYVHDLQQSAKFYTEVLGFQISDVYPEDGGMLPGGAVFVRLNADHHGIALFKASKENRHG